MKINTKKLKYGTAAAVLTIVVIALVILLNVIVSKLSDRYDMSFDLTPEGNFEITDATAEYLSKLNENVEICTTADETFFSKNENIYYRQAYELLKKYARNSDKISLVFNDMTVNPTYVDKYKQYYSGSINQYSVVVFNTDSHRIKVVSVNDLFNTELANYYTFDMTIVSSKAEQVLTSAVMYVTDPDPKKAVYLDVSTQSSVGGNIISMLENNGFDVETIDPFTEALPEDADLIVLNAPLNDFSDDLVKRLYDFMENGGKYGKNMVYLASYAQNDTPNINAFIEEWGIKIGGGVVAENNPQNLASTTSAYAIKAYVETGDYTGGIPAESAKNPVVVYWSRPLEVLFENFGNVKANSLLNTSETAFVMTSEMQEQLSQSQIMPEIEEKVIPVMAISNKYVFIDNDKVLSNLLVIGSDSILDGSLTSQTYCNNGDYFISIINKISGKENGLTIVAKDLSSKTYETDAAQARMLGTVFVFIFPAAIAATGIIIWLRRRHR